MYWPGSEFGRIMGETSKGREKSVTEHGPGRADVAGVAAKAGAGDDAETLQAEGVGHFRHQTVQLQLSGVRILFELNYRILSCVP